MGIMHIVIETNVILKEIVVTVAISAVFVSLLKTLYNTYLGNVHSGHSSGHSF